MGIPKYFSLETMVGGKSVFGAREGWSVRDVINFAEEHPGQELFDHADQLIVLTRLMDMNEGTFIDWKNGTCSFDSQELADVLEYAGQFPERYKYEEEEPTLPQKIADGKLLLTIAYIDEIRDIQMYPAMFGEEVTYTGYPAADGQPGCILNTTGSFAIMNKSKHKGGAWAFIEKYLQEDDRFFRGFPSEKKALDSLISQELTVEYAKDENGNLKLDEAGNPIVIDGGDAIGWGDWIYTYRPCTREEIDTVLRLADTARPVPTCNQEIFKIIYEEAQPYFKGDKSVADVTSLIQSRLSVYVSENS